MLVLSSLFSSYLFDTQDAIINDTREGKVNQVSVVGVGQSYVVGDICNFDSTEDYLSAIVSEVTGPEVIKIESEILSYGKEVVKIVQSDKRTLRTYIEPAVGYLDNDQVIFSGLSTFLQDVSGPKSIVVSNVSMSLFAPLPGAPIGMVTDIFVNSIPDEVSIGSSILIGENVGVGSTAESAGSYQHLPSQQSTSYHQTTAI